MSYLTFQHVKINSLLLCKVHYVVGSESKCSFTGVERRDKLINKTYPRGYRIQDFYSDQKDDNAFYLEKSTAFFVNSLRKV
jgi:hypothetical protein